MKILRWWAGPTVVAATMLVAACGGGSTGTASAPPSSASASTAASVPAAAGSPPAAATLARQVNSATANASSVHITATFVQGGSNGGLNISLTRSNDLYGQITYNNQPVTVLVTQGHAYLKVTAAALKAMGLPSAACVLVCDKYLKMSTGQSKSILGGLGWSALVGQSSSMPQLHYVRTVSMNGQPAWEMRVGGGGTAYVAARGTPYPLRLVKGSNRVDFTQWNGATIPPLPPANQVIDISKLKHL